MTYKKPVKRPGDFQLFVFAGNVEQDPLVFCMDRDTAKGSYVETIYSLLCAMGEVVKDVGLS